MRSAELLSVLLTGTHSCFAAFLDTTRHGSVRLALSILPFLHMKLFSHTAAILTDVHFLIPAAVFCVGLALLITLR